MTSQGTSKSFAAAASGWSPTPPRTNQVKSRKRTVQIFSPETFEPESLHLDNVWRIRLMGPGANNFNPIKLGGFLLSVEAIKSLRCWEEASLYQLGNPSERYMSSSSAICILLFGICGCPEKGM